MLNHSPCCSYHAKQGVLWINAVLVISHLSQCWPQVNQLAGEMSVMYSILEVLAFAMQYPLWKIRPNLFPLKCVGILLVIRVAKRMDSSCWIYTSVLCSSSARGCDRRWCLGKQTWVLQSGPSEIFQTQILYFFHELRPRPH